jgi:hypothetical protein
MTAATGEFTWSTYDTLLRLDFVSFAQRSFAELSPRAAFLMSWHIETVGAKLAALRRGEIRRVVINMPPRHLKSHLASVAFPAWCLGHEPGMQILCVSYAQELADKLSRDRRRIMASGWYRGFSRPGCRRNGRPPRNSRRPPRAAGSRPRSAVC